MGQVLRTPLCQRRAEQLNFVRLAFRNAMGKLDGGGRASWSGGRNARANGMRFLEGTLESLSRDQGCFEKLRRSLEATVVCVPILPVRAYSAVRGGVRA
ncbi:hypothetical protein V6N11_080530 [Hibiscus sabdariffa]|uniref:Uncharacterized protein n=1 Tax=Hibiscus sabdariffa TaxID=183260 RepID=A0ABR2R802_9ROSI